MSDHFVMIVGTRKLEIRKQLESGSKLSEIQNQLLVSTKTPSEFWVDSRVMLQKHGGYNLFLARPVGK